jgi:hypothetical protein
MRPNGKAAMLPFSPEDKYGYSHIGALDGGFVFVDVVLGYKYNSSEAGI